MCDVCLCGMGETQVREGKGECVCVGWEAGGGADGLAFVPPFLCPGVIDGAEEGAWLLLPLLPFPRLWLCAPVSHHQLQHSPLPSSLPP